MLLFFQVFKLFTKVNSEYFSIKLRRRQREHSITNNNIVNSICTIYWTLLKSQEMRAALYSLTINPLLTPLVPAAASPTTIPPWGFLTINLPPSFNAHDALQTVNLLCETQTTAATVPLQSQGWVQPNRAKVWSPNFRAQGQSVCKEAALLQRQTSDI